MQRRTKSLDALLPALYLRGISAGDFQEANMKFHSRSSFETRPGGMLAREKSLTLFKINEAA